MDRGDFDAGLPETLEKSPGQRRFELQPCREVARLTFYPARVPERIAGDMQSFRFNHSRLRKSLKACHSFVRWHLTMAEIETRLFRYFVARADTRHFGRTALSLGISTPTLSNQIKKLETKLNTRLVTRKGNTEIDLT